MRRHPLFPPWAAIAFCLLATPADPAWAQPGVAAQISLGTPVPHDQLREMSTDRPDKTESPYTIDAGHLQIELDFATYTRDRENGIRTETLAVAPVNFKLGLTSGTDLQLVLEPYIRQAVSNGGGHIDGVGDATVRLKHNLFGNDGGSAALAVMPFIKLPTASKGLGNGAVELGLIVPLALDLSEHIGIGLMTEIDLLEETGGSRYAPSFVNSATVSYELTDRLGLYTELFTERSIERGARWVVTGDAGLTYALTPDVQFDTGLNLGLTHASDDLNIFVGISRRF